MSKSLKLLGREIEASLVEVNSLLYELHQQHAAIDLTKAAYVKLLQTFPRTGRTSLQSPEWLEQIDDRMAHVWHMAFNRKRALLKCYHELRQAGLQ